MVLGGPILIENLFHLDTMFRCRRANVVIDQVLTGWSEGFAVKVMKIKSPVIARIMENVLRFFLE